MSQTDLKKTALYGTHISLGATMIELDGYTLPGHYPIDGVMETRRKWHAAKTESDGKWTRIVREEFTQISKYPALSYIAPFFGPDCSTIVEHSIFGKMFVSNMGLTGELGYIVAIDNNYVADLWNAFVRDRGDVRPVGLEAIDTLRTEAYYPLYGQDINEIGTPVEAGFNWSVRMDLRGSEHEHDHSIKCLGADIIKDQINNGSKRERFGIKVLGEGVIRPGLELFYLNQATNDYIPVGAVTSGCFTPSIVDYNDPEMSLVLDAQNPFGFLEEIENNLKSKDPGTRISALTKIESFPSFSVGQGYVNLDTGFNITFGSIIYCKIDNDMRPVLLTRLLFHGSRAWLIYKR